MVLISTAFIVSYVPTLIQYTFEAVGIIKMSTRYNFFQQYTLSINLIANPFIYTLTQQRFKEFIQSMIKRSLMRRNGEPQMRALEYGTERTDTK